MDRNDAPQMLIAVAEAAQDVAAGLNKFLSLVAESAAEITALIAKCFAVSSALRNLATAIEELRRYSSYNKIADDIADVNTSLDYTFKDVHHAVGEGFASLKNTGVPIAAAYRRVWGDISARFQQESGNTLTRRLEYCRSYLQELTNILQEGSPRDSASFDDLAERIYKLLQVQDGTPRSTLDGPRAPSPPTPGPKKPPSFERTRPSAGQTSSAESSKGKKGVRFSMEPDWDDVHPPPAPEVPLSPTPMDTVPNSFLDHNPASEHWLPKVFERVPPSTELPRINQSSVCLGPDLADAIERLKNDFDKLIDIPFESGDLRVSFYYRPEDERARMLCRTIRPARNQKICCLPLTALRVERNGPFLKFVRVSANSRQLWACLRFTTHESLALFFCIFLSLRSHDTGDPMNSIDDHLLYGEQEIFRGFIDDDHFQHMLCLLKDRQSKCVRLQASVLRGDMAKTPVWTAFITYQIYSPHWMKKGPSAKTVHFADLHRYVFTDDYEAQACEGGGHEICFTYDGDAKAFMHVIHDLSRASRAV